MSPLKEVRVEHLTVLKTRRTAEDEIYLTFKFYFFSTYQLTPG